MEDLSFGVWLSRHRKSLGLTQKQLADKVNCATITLRKIEADQRRVSVQIAERLAQAMNFEPEEQTTFVKFARGEGNRIFPMNRKIIQRYPPSKTIHSLLPTPITSLIGRDDDVKAIRKYILEEKSRLVTLVGPPGIGKTRLVYEAARGLTENLLGPVGYINLALIELPDQIPPAILQSLGVVEIPGKPHVDLLKDGIADNSTLLVLDNVEHLIENVSFLVYDLLISCPQLIVLLTSREALRIPGEMVYQVPPLETPPGEKLDLITPALAVKYSAVKLFIERARNVRPDFSLNQEDVRDISEICRRLDGLPLAIELLAARINIMTPHMILSHLDHRVVLHTSLVGSLPAYHKSLYQAIDWSYSSLSPEEMHLFAYLSVFSGGFTLEQVETAFSDLFFQNDVSSLLGSLVEKSLLHVSAAQDSDQRFNMLTVLQQFASEKLNELGEVDYARQRHLDYFQKFSMAVRGVIFTPQQVIWIDRLEMEQNNLRFALNWCITQKKTEPALLILSVLSWFWLLKGNYSEFECWREMIESLPKIGVHLLHYQELAALLKQPINEQGLNSLHI